MKIFNDGGIEKGEKIRGPWIIETFFFLHRYTVGVLTSMLQRRDILHNPE